MVSLVKLPAMSPVSLIKPDVTYPARIAGVSAHHARRGLHILPLRAAF